MRNFPEWSIAFWAAAAAGAVVVPLNAWWTADELEYGLRDSGAKVVFVDAERLERLTEVLPGARPHDRRRARRCATTPAASSGGKTLLGDGARRRRAARRRARARGPRDDLLHVGHDRPAEGRARHAPQHLREPDLARVRGAARADARRARSRRPRRARTCTCCRCRSSTRPAATRSSSRTSRPAASSC